MLQNFAPWQQTLRVFGSTPSSRAWLLTQWVQQEKKPALVICPTDEEASLMARNARALSFSGNSVPSLWLPTWEHSPYRSIAPSLRTRHRRISVLSAAAKPSGGLIVCASPAAIQQTTLPREVLLKHSLTLRAGDEVESREWLAGLLQESGYLRTEPVEDPGSFSLRGEIIDVYPPNESLPFRIELFDTQIEKIRTYDPVSQKTRESHETVHIIPAREFLLRKETYSRTREAVKERADSLGIQRRVRDPVLEMIQNGDYPDHSDSWCPFAYGSDHTFWEFTDENWRVFWVHEEQCLQNFEAFFEKLSDENLEDTGVIVPQKEALFRKNVPENSTAVHFDQIEMAKLGEDREQVRVQITENSDLKHKKEELPSVFQNWLDSDFEVNILATTQSELERIEYILSGKGIAADQIHYRLGDLSEGFRWPGERMIVVTDEELLGTRHRRGPAPRKSAAQDWSGLNALSDLGVGDLVVHIEHGIGRYLGLKRLGVDGAESDFLQLEYANKDKLYLPVYRLSMIQRYVGGSSDALLGRLGGQQFEKTKQKVRASIQKLAIDLVDLYAKRKLQKGFAVHPRDPQFREFEAQFPFHETDDQLRAIDETLQDLERGKLMDRLICGDVGYGKTEVAIRAAYQMVMSGKQVCVLVPTTLLAHQHENSFRERLQGQPIQIDGLSRLKSVKDRKQALENARLGKTDILIGTHRVLSKDVQFKDLGLIVVDEEHRFGVEHKEKLKTMSAGLHVLTLTATPIPRTLHMALSGLRDISLMTTPPVNRLPIRTFVSKWDEPVIRNAIDMEINRGGQVFVVHHRVESIFELAKKIEEIQPKAKIVVAHGQMTERELETAIMKFYKKEANVLVCTKIIESGIDIPNANTIIINRAEMFGLAELYQLRGRVGRSDHRAYAYLLVPRSGALTDKARQRLEVIQRFVELGSGFNIASYDLEIRGGGNLLGPQQSGHIAAVGFDLYTELLDEAIANLQSSGEPAPEKPKEPEIKVPFSAYLDEKWIPDVHQRLTHYRRISSAASEEELQTFESELRDRYGNLPEEAMNLLWIIRIKLLLKQMGVEVLTVGKQRVSLSSSPKSLLDPARAVALVSSQPDRYQITPDSKFVLKLKTDTLKDLYFAIETLLSNLAPQQDSKS